MASGVGGLSGLDGLDPFAGLGSSACASTVAPTAPRLNRGSCVAPLQREGWDLPACLPRCRAAIDEALPQLASATSNPDDRPRAPRRRGSAHPRTSVRRSAATIEGAAAGGSGARGRSERAEDSRGACWLAAEKKPPASGSEAGRMWHTFERQDDLGEKGGEGRAE